MMFRTLSCACSWFLVVAVLQGGDTLGGEKASIAEHIHSVLKESKTGVAKAIGAQNHEEAREILRKRNEKLKTLLGRNQLGASPLVSKADGEAIINAYEILRQWDNVISFAEKHVESHPSSERAYMSILKSLVNLKRVEEARKLLASIEHEFDENSCMRFAPSLIASFGQTEKKWQIAVEHSSIAATRRIEVLREHPNIAHWAMFDFRRMAEAAVASNSEKLTALATKQLKEVEKELDKTIHEIKRDREFIDLYSMDDPSDVDDSENKKRVDFSDLYLSLFNQQCLAMLLKSDVSYWLGKEDAGVPFEVYVDFLIATWKSNRPFEKSMRSRVGGLLKYLHQNGRVYTDEMVRALNKLEKHIESLRSKHSKDKELARLGIQCKHLIEGEAFRPRLENMPYGGIGLRKLQKQP